MYLMNVPPVAATQTEWRTCGPPGGYSLQCFNDSDTELSTAGTPISDKVQMIIESLRSTQSSLEMGDEMEGNVLSGREGHPQVCRVSVASYVGAKSKTKVSHENREADVSPAVNRGSSDSDSDDSVDRGIEEAIREYLKEKGDHKRKAEPYSPFLQSSKIPRKNPPVPEFSKQTSDNNAFLISTSQFPKSVKVEPLTAPLGIPIKKYIKNKAFLDDNVVKNLSSSKSTATKSFPKEPTKSPSKEFSQFNKVKCSVPIKVEEDLSDSSSDDGIEEAIQRYQLEKKEQQNRREDLSPRAFKQDSDSTSDDGIEEAIRSYQLEQLKEKSVLKPFLHQQNAFGKSLLEAVGSTSSENLKKHKLKKKRTRTEREVKSVAHSPFFLPKNTCSDNQVGKGNGLLSFKLDTFKEQPTPTPPKINTSAELMCAEAILDISKTVMPEAFHQDVGPSGCVTPDSSVQPSPIPNFQDVESDDSSIDSEDGIEQEIRKFLEQKAQMHKQPPTFATSPESQSKNQPEKTKTKQVVAQKKRQRLSLTQRRKYKEENGTVCDMYAVNNTVKETSLRPLPEHRKDSGSLVFSQRKPTYPIAGLRKTEQSGDKSSSLDSDEDLDTAIRDLLKTKRKSKKKTGDLKRKSKKCLKDEPLQKNVIQTKKLTPELMPKSSALKKTHKKHYDIKESEVNKKHFSQHKQTDKDKVHGDEKESVKVTEDQDTVSQHNNHLALQIKDDSSSVDSDDSIEQEIRRFLAEKAKGSAAEQDKDEGIESRNGTVTVCNPLQAKDIKQEIHLAAIPSNSSTSPPAGKSPLVCQSQERQFPPTPQSLLPDVSTVGSGSRRSSIQSCSPVVLEPADGAGAARTDQRRPSAGKGDVQDGTPKMERVQPVCTPNIDHSRAESIKWRQSLGLPPTDTRTVSRPSFHITSSKTNETASAKPLYQSRGINFKSQTPVTSWSSARTGKSPFSSSTETPVNTPFRSSVLNLATARHPRMAFVQSLLPGHSSQCPGEEKESMVHMSKDKSVFVELESNRTNHVQVRSRERSEGKERADLLSEKKEVASSKKNEKEGHLEKAEEEFVDEADCESGIRRDPETKQGFSTLCLSSAIDPGITFRPCIALTTEERSLMFSRRYAVRTCNKVKTHSIQGPTRIRTVPPVKRRLQFVSVNRTNVVPR